MSPEDARKLAAKHATGNLTPAEAETLYQAAAEHQEVFDDLMGEEFVRLALQDDGNRNEIRRALRESLPAEKEGLWMAFLRWVARPIGLTSAAALAGALVLLVVLHSSHAPKAPLARPAELTNYAAGPALATDLFALAEASPKPAEVSGLAPQYKMGDEWRMRIIVGETSNVVVVQLGPDGKYTPLFPNAGRPSPLVQAGTDVLIPPSGEASTIVKAPAGVYRVRIGVFPEDVNPLSGTSWQTGDLAAKITVIERSYRVVE